MPLLRVACLCEPALLVKQGDVASNTDPARVAKLSPETADRLTRKYDKTRRRIGQAAVAG